MKMNKTKICGHGIGNFETTVYKLPHGKNRKYQFTYQKDQKNEIVLAYFDTEEKARLYQDAFTEGINAN